VEIGEEDSGEGLKMKDWSLEITNDHLRRRKFGRSELRGD